MNVLTFTLLAWLGITALAWCIDYGPEIYDEQMSAWREKHPKTAKAPTLAVVEDAETKEGIKVYRQAKMDEFQMVFVIDKRSEHSRQKHGRHAKS